MSELSTILLLACTTCLNSSNIDQVAQLPTAACAPPQQQQSAECSPVATATATSPAPARPVVAQSTTPIGPYSRGERVVELQTQLKQLGYYGGELDGIYGRLTRSAVTRFQQENGLRSDGIVGTKTQQFLIEAGQSTTAAPDVVTASEQPTDAASDSSSEFSFESSPETALPTDSSFDDTSFIEPDTDVKPDIESNPSTPPAQPAQTSTVNSAEPLTSTPVASTDSPQATPPVLAPEVTQTIWSSSTAAIQTVFGAPSGPMKHTFAVVAGISLIAGWGVVIRREAKRNVLIEEDLGLSSDIELLLADLPTSPDPIVDQTTSRPAKSTARRAKTLVATLVSNDCTSESAYTYSLVDDAKGSFVLINRELWLTHRRPDQENLNRYTVVIRCTDRRGVSIDQPFRIRVMPSFTSPPRPTAEGINGSQGNRVKALSSIG